jgi:hypothetical protein
VEGLSRWSASFQALRSGRLLGLPEDLVDLRDVDEQFLADDRVVLRLASSSPPPAFLVAMLNSSCSFGYFPECGGLK